MNVKLWAGKMGNTKHMGIMFLWFGGSRRQSFDALWR
jgi:hypothetical protein